MLTDLTCLKSSHGLQLLSFRKLAVKSRGEKSEAQTLRIAYTRQTIDNVKYQVTKIFNYLNCQFAGQQIRTSS